MKKLFILLTVSLLALFFVACDQEGVDSQRGSVILSFAPNGKLTTRTIVPEGENPLQISHYSISGTGPKGQVLETLSSTTDSVTINNLLVGSWHFSATAYNAENKALATGSIDTYIVSNNNIVTIALDEVVGSGSLELSFDWDQSQVTEDSQFNVVVYDETNTVVDSTQVTSSMEQGEGNLLVSNLSAGFYTVVATLQSDSVQISGFSETVRIIDDTKTSSTIELIIGKVIDGVSLLINDQTDSPIIGTISSSKSSPEKGDTITLTYETEETSSYDPTSLIYWWYKDGELIEQSASKSIEIENLPAGTSRYDVVVGTETNNSLGSSSILISIEIVPSVASI